jgi:hypothetical protein
VPYPVEQKIPHEIFCLVSASAEVECRNSASGNAQRGVKHAILQPDNLRARTSTPQFCIAPQYSAQSFFSKNIQARFNSNFFALLGAFFWGFGEAHFS